MAGEEKGVIRIISKSHTDRAESITLNATEGSIVLTSADTIELYGEQGGVVFGEYEPPPKKDPQSYYFARGWWSFDFKGEKIIRRAVPGMTVYFHLETKNIPDGEAVYMRLFDEDNHESEEPDNADGSADKDDHIQLSRTATGKITVYEEVKNNKIVKAIVLKNIHNVLDNEADKLLELYFRCSYKKEHKQYPKSREDYLKVGQLVIDRYKMPGLNGEGTDIANDMAYGTGHKYNGAIYGLDLVTQFIKEYKENGFNEEKHALFSNAEDFPGQPTIEKKPGQTTSEEPYRQKADHTRVDRPDPVDIVNAGIRNANNNRKAKYSKEECYSAKYKDYESGLDLKRFHESWRTDGYLFWNFRNTAGLWFARGELQDNLDRMIDKFQRNEGGIYEDAVLTRHVANHTNTNQYCFYIENYIAERLKKDILKLEDVEDKEPQFEKDLQTRRDNGKIKGSDIKDEKGLPVPITRPAYSYNDGLWEASKGLTIALNDIWATEVILQELKFSGDNYEGRYQVTLWDHFGLDLPDMEKKFNAYPSIQEAFACWFILQHLRGYKPFIAKMTFMREFSGNLHEGREERRAKQKAKEEKEKEDRKQRIRELQNFGRKKPWEY